MRSHRGGIFEEESSVRVSLSLENLCGVRLDDLYENDSAGQTGGGSQYNLFLFS